MNTVLYISFAVCLLLAPLVEVRADDAGKLCRFKHNTCDFEQAALEVHPEDMACFENEPVWRQLSYIDCSPNLSSAWMHFYKNEVLGGSEPDTAMSFLKYRALSRSYEDNQTLLSLIQKYNIDLGAIGPMYREAIAWAEAEKKKTGQELYDRAQDIKLSETYDDNVMKKLLYSAYTRQAADKGHKKAKREVHERVQIE